MFLHDQLLIFLFNLKSSFNNNSHSNSSISNKLSNKISKTFRLIINQWWINDKYYISYIFINFIWDLLLKYKKYII